MGYGPTAVVVASAPGMLRGELWGGGGVPLCARLSSLGTVIPMGKKP